MQQKQQHHLFQPHAYFLPRRNVVDISHDATHRSFIYAINASERNFTSSRSPQAELSGRAYRGLSNSRDCFKVVVSSTKRCNLSDLTKKRLFCFFCFFWVSQSHIFRRPIKILQCPFCSNGSFLAFKANTLKIPESRQTKRLRWVYKMQCEQVTPCKNMIAFMGKAQSSLAPAEIWLAPEVPLLRYCKKKKCFEY